MHVAAARAPEHKAQKRARPAAAAPSTHSAFATDARPSLTLRRCACGGGCPSCRAEPAPASGAASIAIGPADDSFEREAESIAASIGSAPVREASSASTIASHMSAPASVQRCGCGGPAPAGGTCASCAAEHEDEVEQPSMMQRAPISGAAEPPSAPGSVHATLASPGRSLDTSVRADMESHLGADFGGVRVHSDDAAAASARDVDARAYTVGAHVVFAAREYAPATTAGRQLLAHELTHVVQQGAAPRAKGGASLQRTPSQRVQRAPTTPAKIPLLCNELIKAPEQLGPDGHINGIKVHKAVGDAFKAEMADKKATKGMKIPGGFWREGAQGCGEAGKSQNAPRPGMYDKVGDGTPDLVFKRDDDVVELAELKPATITCVPEAESQVANYVAKGNADYNAEWRTKRKIKKFEPMAVGRSTIRHVEAEGMVVALSWCEPGVIVYKPVLADDKDNITCGIKDADLDRVINKLLDPAQGAANREISEKIDKPISKLIDGMSIHDAITKVWKKGRRPIIDAIADHLGITGQVIVENVDDVEFVDTIATWLQKNLSEDASVALRSLAHGVKDEMINRLRTLVQKSMKDALKDALIAACASSLVGVLALSKVLEKYLEQLRAHLSRLAGEVVKTMVLEGVRALARAALEGLGKAVLAAVAIVAVIFFLPEELLAGVIAAIGEAIAALFSAIGTAVAGLIEQLIAATASGGILSGLTGALGIGKLAY
jgi:hypothetical protein